MRIALLLALFLASPLAAQEGRDAPGARPLPLPPQRQEQRPLPPPWVLIRTAEQHAFWRNLFWVAVGATAAAFLIMVHDRTRR